MCDLFFHSSTLASTTQQNWRKYGALCKRPNLGCSYMVIQTNRTVYSAKSLIFHSKTSGAGRRGVLHSKAVPLRSTQHRSPALDAQPLGHATWAFYGAAGVLQGTICYSLHVLFIVIHSILWIYKEKSNPKKLGATYGRRFYCNSSNKKISKTPPDKFQARSKERNGETKAVETTSIYIFQLSCIQFPAKGFSCDEQDCKIQKRDTVVFMILFR